MMVIGMTEKEETKCDSPKVALLTSAREDLRSDLNRELRQLAADFERQLCDTADQLRKHIREDSRHIQTLAQMSTSQEMQRSFAELREVFQKQSISGIGKRRRSKQAGAYPNENSLPHMGCATASDPAALQTKNINELSLCMVDVDSSDGEQEMIDESATIDPGSPGYTPMPVKTTKRSNTWNSILPKPSAQSENAPVTADALGAKSGVSEPTIGKRNESRGFQIPIRTSSDASTRSEKSSATRRSSRMIVSHKARTRISHGAKKSHDQTGVTQIPSISSNSAWHVRVYTDVETRLLQLVSHAFFENAVTIFILLNGVMVGVQTHVMAVRVIDVAPIPFQVLEWVFATFFTIELCLRLLAYRLNFFTMTGNGWNIFDLIIVGLQLVEIMMEIVAAGLGFSFNILRILRLIRVIRLARALRLIAELRTIVSSIAGSMKSLFWTGVLLFMIVYVLGVGITQHVLNKRIALKKDYEDVPNDLEHFWGDLTRSIFSLFEAITGGVDWDQVARPLIDYVGIEMAIIFSAYIIFAVLAMLNVVTGVFIGSVMENRSLEQELRTQIQLTNQFRSFDLDANGEISWTQFQDQLESKSMKDFFKTIDVDITNARFLFELLDLDGSESVNVEEFVDGCMRIWGPSKGLDVRMLRRDIGRLAKDMERLLKGGERPGSRSRTLV